MSDLAPKTTLEKIAQLVEVNNAQDGLRILNQFDFGKSPAETLGWMIATAVWQYWRNDNGLSARNSAVIDAVETIRRSLKVRPEYQNAEVEQMIVFYNENIAEIFTRGWYVPSDYRRVVAWTI